MLNNSYQYNVSHFISSLTCYKIYVCSINRISTMFPISYHHWPVTKYMYVCSQSLHHISFHIRISNFENLFILVSHELLDCCCWCFFLVPNVKICFFSFWDFFWDFFWWHFWMQITTRIPLVYTLPQTTITLNSR